MATVRANNHSLEGSSRKRLKISRDGARATPSPALSAPKATSSAPEAESSKSAQEHAHSGPCQHEAALKTLNTDIDAMRHLVTCQICHRLMYEPYALSCGHTYCYSCLTQWLGGNRKKTCPDCRTVIVQQPTPSYVIRELVLVFVGRNQLLPDGETSEEHNTMAKEESEVVAKDKANKDPRTGGLFKGCFRRGGQLPLQALHDPGDGVERCPQCHWEVEDGYCNQCGMPVGDEHLGFSDYSGDSESTNDELDGELDEFDNETEFGGHDDIVDLVEGDDGLEDMDPAIFQAVYGDFGQPPPAMMPRRGLTAGRRRTPIPISSDMSEGDSDEEDYDPSLGGFIADDEPLSDRGGLTDAYNSDDSDVQEVTSQPRRRRRAPIVISDDEEDDAEAGAISVHGSDNDDDDEGEDEEPVAAPSQGVKRRRGHAATQHHVALSSSDEDSSDDDEEDGFRHTDTRGQPLDDHYVPGAFSPLQRSASGDTDEHDAEEDESAAASSVVGTNGYLNTDHEEYDESESEDDESGSENGWDTRAEAQATRRTDDNPVRGPGHLRVSGRPGPATSTTNFPEFMRVFDNANRRLLTASTYLPPSVSSTTQPNHPFQLSNTLANINRQQGRATRRRRSITSAESSQSSNGGGVEIQSTSSSGGSSHTIGRSPEAGRRKRPQQHATRREVGLDALHRGLRRLHEQDQARANERRRRA